MAMRDFDILMPDIDVRAPGCPEPTAIAAIRDALVELCEDARAWPVSESFPLSPTEDEILVAPNGTLIVDIEMVTFDGVPLDPISLPDLQARHHHWQSNPGCPRFYTQVRPDSLAVVPRNGGEQVHVRLFLKPGPFLDCAPSFVLDQHRLALVDGALSRILEIPGQAFSDPQRAAYHAAKWSQAKDRASAKFLQGQQQAPIRARPQFF